MHIFRFLPALALALVICSLATAGGKVDKTKIPGLPNITCDLNLLELDGKGIAKSLRGSFKLTKVGVNQKTGVIFWLLTLQVDEPDYHSIRGAWGLTPSDVEEAGPTMIFKDEDKVKIGAAPFVLQGFHYQMRKGDGVRAIVQVPPDVPLDNVRFVTVVE